MTKRFTPLEIAAQRAIKRVFDPESLFNPGIMLPDESPEEPDVASFEAAVRAALESHRTGAARHGTPAASTNAGGEANIAVNIANLSLVVGSEVTLEQLSCCLADHGVTCAAIPSEASQRTVGELVANATGAERAAVRHALLGLQVALADGEARARFGGETMKDVAGYDTKRLFIGSHNAFGTICAAVFKISINQSEHNR